MNQNPFPGLRPFREGEEELFFGRESQVDSMVERLAHTRFLAVLGTSGSGKSSLVTCGLRPALHRGLMVDAGTSWRIVRMRPGGDPIKALATALVAHPDLFVGEPDRETLVKVVEANLHMSKLGLIDVFGQARPNAATRLLVVVDQFEELFRYRGLDSRRRDLEPADRDVVQNENAIKLVHLLLEARQWPLSGVYVVLTMRSDFLGDCTRFPGLTEALNEGQYLIPRMSLDERREAIRGPAAVFGAEIAPSLMNQLVNDVGDDPDQLSILQHALHRTWEEWSREDDGAPIGLKHYEAIGTMSGALNLHAEKAYGELDESHKEICGKLFKALTDKGIDVRGIRRPTRLDTLCAVLDEEQDNIAKVVEVFRRPSRSFLVPPPPKELTSTTIIDISHESLMRIWSRLRAWAGEEAQSAELYLRLARDAELYQKELKSLWRDPELEAGLQWRDTNQPNAAWAERYGGDFEEAMTFLNESERQRAGERAAREETRRSQLRSARLRALAAMVVALVFLALALGTARLESIRSANLFEAELTRASLLARNESFTQAIDALLKTEEVERDVPAARRKVRDLLAWYTDLISSAPAYVYDDANAPLLSVAVSRDGRLLAGVGETGVVAVFSIEDGRLLRRWTDCEYGDDCRMTQAVFDPAGDWLATLDDGDNIVLWNPINSEEIRRISTSRARALAVSPDGTLLASGNLDGELTLWNADTGDPIETLVLHQDQIRDIEFSPDGQLLASASDDRTVQIVDLKSRELRYRFAHDRGAINVVFHPGGRLVGTSTWDRVDLWSLQQYDEAVEAARETVLLTQRFPHAANELEAALELDIRPLYSFQSRTNVVYGLTFAAGGKALVSASRDHSLRLWDATNGNALRVLDAHTLGVTDVVAQDGQIFSSSFDGTLMRWDREVQKVRELRFDGGPRQLPNLLPEGVELSSSTLSPSDDFLAIVGETATGDDLWLFSLQELPPVMAPSSGKLLPAGAHVDEVAFAPGGRILAVTADVGPKTGIWLVDLKPEPSAIEISPDTVLPETAEIWESHFSSDGCCLAIFAALPSGEEIWLLDLETRPMTASVSSGNLLPDNTVIYSISPSSEGRKLLLEGSDDSGETIWVLDLAASPDSIRDAFPDRLPDETSLLSTTLSADGRKLAVTGFVDDEAIAWLVDLEPPIATTKSLLSEVPDETLSIAGDFSPYRNRMVLVASLDSEDVETGYVTKMWFVDPTKPNDNTAFFPATFLPQTAQALIHTFSPNGKYVAILAPASHEDSDPLDVPVGMKLVDLKTWPPSVLASSQEFLHKDSRVTDTFFSPDGERLLVISSSEEGKSVSLMDLSTPQVSIRRGSEAILPGSADVVDATFSPDGKHVALVGYSMPVLVVDLSELRARYKLSAHEDTAYQASFLLDGEVLATASHDFSARFWDMTAGDLLFSLFQRPSINDSSEHLEITDAEVETPPKIGFQCRPPSAGGCWLKWESEKEPVLYRLRGFDEP